MFHESQAITSLLSAPESFRSRSYIPLRRSVENPLCAQQPARSSRGFMKHVG